MPEVPAFVPVGTGCSFVPETGAKRVPIVLSPRVHEELRADAVDGLRSLPRRGLEIGGILLGSARGRILIESIEPVDSEHLYGPRYRQSERDRERFADVFQLKAHGAGGTVPVGLFRTVTLEGDGLGPTDSEWMRTHFGDRNAVLLIVSPKMTGRADLACYYWDGGEFTPCLESPYSPDSPTGESPETESVAAHSPVTPPVTPSATPPRSKPRALGWLLEVVLAGIAAVLVFGGISLFHHEPAAARAPAEQPARVEAPSRIGLRAEFTGGGTTLTWDNRSDLFRNALGALLTVSDAGVQKELPITVAELQTGRIEYGPTAPSSSFDLTVFRSEQGAISESASAPQASPPRVKKPPARPVRGRRRLRAEAVHSPAGAPATLNLPPPVTSGSSSIFPK